MSNTSLDFRDRRAVFAALEEAPFDLLVIGAGITGCGVARDAAMRGLRVALVDAADIGAGTSSRSSKLIHGGVRYLAQGQMSIVREAATERKTLRRIAPHLAQTTRLIVPGHSRAALLKFKAGLLGYERLGDVDASERHEMWDVERLRVEEPLLRTRNVRGAVVYPEYVTDDARLTLANARSAAAAGAVVATYAPVTRILTENGRAVGATVSGALRGENLGGTIRARVVVNAAGPWLDAVRALEEAAAPPLLQLTKGIHVTVNRERLPIRHTVIIVTADKRSIFAVPRGEFVYFGTTDTFYPEAEYWPEITREDIDYLLRCGEAGFNTAPISDNDVVSMWSGVRPLLAQAGKSPSEISRRHEILKGPHGVMSIAGGKLTSYRSMAERIVDKCEEQLGRATGTCRTAEQPLPGGDLDDVSILEAALGQHGIGDTESARFARLYGSEAERVVADGADVAAEARWAVLHEGALTLEDYWVRRSARARFDDDGGTAALEPAAAALGESLGWDSSERSRQAAACRAARAREMSALHEEGSRRATGSR
jgi:glycerol-3-phosphate dehydrogenase